MDANMAAVAAGQAASSINLMETVMGITYIGGQGCTLALVLMCMRSNVKKLKSIGRVCIFPAIFNINEPIVFVCRVWNPSHMIPLCLNSIIIPSLMYLVMRIGLVPIPSAPYPDVVSSKYRTRLSDNEQYVRGYSGNCIVCCILADLDAIL